MSGSEYFFAHGDDAMMMMMRQGDLFFGSAGMTRELLFAFRSCQCQATT
jgi:hypothetical protein